MKREKTDYPIIVLVLAILGFIVFSRLIHLANVGNEVFHDEKWYMRLATSLGTEVPEGEDPLSEKPPLYTLFLAGTLFLFRGDLTAIKVLQVLLNAASALLLFVVVRGEFGKVAGLVALAACALYVPYVAMPLILMSEALYLPLLVLFSFLLVRMHREPNGWRWSFLLGLVGGVTSLVRDIFLPLLILYAVVLVFRRRPWRGNLRGAGIVLLGLVMVVGPFTVRNCVRHKAFIPISTVGASNLWFFPTWQGKQGREFAEEVWRAEEDVGNRWSKGIRTGIPAVFKHPRENLERMWQNARKLVAPGGSARSYFVWRLLRKPGVVPMAWAASYIRLQMVFYWGIVFAGIFGLVVCRRSPLWGWTLLLIVYVLVVHSFFEAKFRFTWPATLMLIPFGSAVLPRLWSRARPLIGHK